MQEENKNFFTVIDTKDARTRLDKFLSLAMNNSRSSVQRFIKEGCVFINDTVQADTSYTLKAGDKIAVHVPEPKEANPKPENINLDILYEDSDLLVVNKPAGMVVHEGAGVFEKTLVNALLHHCGNSLSGIGGVKRPGIVHRIDKETSGLLVVAKNDAAHIGLSAQFEKHSIERTYFAFVYGLPNPLKGTIEGNISRSKFDRKKMALCAHGGKEAVTHYETVEAFGCYAAMVKCQLKTGRTHQIRVHLSSIGHHLIGDKVYKTGTNAVLKIPLAIREFTDHFDRQALHAATLGFIHPRTKERLFFESPLPSDLTLLWEKLRAGVQD